MIASTEAQNLSPLVAATNDTPGLLQASGESPQATLDRARAFAQPLIAGEALETGEDSFAHAQAVAQILADMGASLAMQAASYLIYAANHLQKPQDVIAKAFGEGHAKLAIETNRLVQVQAQSRAASAKAQILDDPATQTEVVRKMLLAFSKDLRVVLLRLASRLQSLRYYAAAKLSAPPPVARETLAVFAPLANRLGIWQIKWELEDLAFRFLEPETYFGIAKQLDEKRTDRESYMAGLRERLTAGLEANGVRATVQGRPKHIYSIVKKMRGKALDFAKVFDVRAVRVIVPEPADCYAALAWVHAQFSPVASEFDDYIAKPKPNGYQSLHTVVLDTSDAGKSRPVEIQIRTQTMHEHAEHGVAAHWAYKEAGAKGYAGVSASTAPGSYDAKLAVLRQLLAWERELTHDAQGAALHTEAMSDRIYVLTPDAAVVELPQGATAIDFAYAVHTDLGHRCRGARVGGALLPLTTPLANGQTVEIISAKEGGPSRDWLNPELGFLASSRAKSKVRAWFNAVQASETIARGRELLDKTLQRVGKTAANLEDLALALAFKTTDALCEALGKDELSPRAIENHFSPPAQALDADAYLLHKTEQKNKKTPGQSSKNAQKSGVLVVGVGSLLTQLAKCCKPAPPDVISGFVTRGKGVSIHREGCASFVELVRRAPERVVEVTWGVSQAAVYPVDVSVRAQDRQGLLRDISEVFAREKFNVIGVQTQSVREQGASVAWMLFTVEVADSHKLQRVFESVKGVSGVLGVRRK